MLMDEGTVDLVGKERCDGWDERGVCYCWIPPGTTMNITDSYT